MSVSNAIYLAFDAKNDSRYADMMRSWQQEDGSPYLFRDSLELKQNQALGPEEALKRQIFERIDDCDVFVLLTSENTRYPFKFLEWEIERAKSRNKPILIMNTNGSRFRDDTCCPLAMRNTLAIHICFVQAVFDHAIRTWPLRVHEIGLDNRGVSFCYSESLYKRLGL